MTPPDPIRIAIINDYEIVVAGIAALLAPFSDRVVVVELDARMPVRSEVDLVLYDSFGQVQGEALDIDSLVEHGTAPVVVFSWNTDPALVEQSLRAGAVGYLAKGVSGDRLVELLERVRSGEAVTPERAAMHDGDEFGQWPGREHGLSPRESEVLALLCQGMDNDEIASRALVGTNTLKTHIRSLYRKIGVASRTRAVLWGVDHGFRPDRSRQRPGPG